MLVIVEDWNLQGPAQLRLNDEALRRFNILQVDSTECGLQHLAGADDILRVVGGQLKIKDIDVGKAFEEDRLPLHDRLACGRTDVAQTQNSGPVRNYGNQVRLSRVLVDEIRLALDGQARSGYSGSVGQAQITLGQARLGRGDRNLAWGVG